MTPFFQIPVDATGSTVLIGVTVQAEANNANPGNACFIDIKSSRFHETFKTQHQGLDNAEPTSAAGKIHKIDSQHTKLSDPASAATAKMQKPVRTLRK
ncbi:MAG: hypothetical protein D9N14_00025 [Ketobacter sp.]|nr:MAG: hypothetical protein D9N14_00025 [Ketobacter sp.]